MTALGYLQPPVCDHLRAPFIQEARAMWSRAHDSWAGGKLGVDRDLPLKIYPRARSLPFLPSPSVCLP